MIIQVYYGNDHDEIAQLDDQDCQEWIGSPASYECFNSRSHRADAGKADTGTHWCEMIWSTAGQDSRTVTGCIKNRPRIWIEAPCKERLLRTARSATDQRHSPSQSSFWRIHFINIASCACTASPVSRFGLLFTSFFKKLIGSPALSAPSAMHWKESVIADLAYQSVNANSVSACERIFQTDWEPSCLTFEVETQRIVHLGWSVIILKPEGLPTAVRDVPLVNKSICVPMGDVEGDLIVDYQMLRFNWFIVSSKKSRFTVAGVGGIAARQLVTKTLKT